MHKTDKTNIDKTNVVFSVDMSKHPFTDLDVSEDIEYYIERIAYLESLVRQYKFDTLTGLMMKHDFQNAFDLLFEEYQFADSEFYMCLLDINGLHNINRIKGYSSGDNLIKTVAEQLRTEFAIHQIYRISGDEFVVLVRKSTLALDAFKDRMQRINDIEYVLESCVEYTSPKQMFKLMDKKLSSLKSKKSKDRV